MTTPVLWQFKCSHFCEKVRWALDWKDIEYRERSFYPGWHVLPTLLVSRGQQVPLLRTGGQTLRDSTRILEHLEATHPEPALYPGSASERERAIALEDAFDRLGPALRCVHYSLMLPDLETSATFFANTDHGPAFRAFRPTFLRIFGPTMPRFMGFDEESVRRSRDEVEAILGLFESEVRPSGYLVGDGFGVADLTLAALLSTFLVPPELPYPPPRPFPEPVQEYRQSLERFAALAWAREIYAKHRSRERSREEGRVR